MKDKIVSYLKKIEKEENIKILFAVESGSRLWRFSSKDSDYDIRFVFVQPIEKYLSVRNELQTDLVINHNFENGLIDLSGFDLFKFCKLLLKSNPSVIEWMQADIVYYGLKPKKLQRIALTEFDPAALYYHYKSMCRFNYGKYLASKQEVTYKKYLYALRGAINAQYVLNRRKLPPIDFLKCLDQSKGFVPVEIIGKLKEIIHLKKLGIESQIIQNIPLYDQYIEKFLNDETNFFSKKLISEDKINKEIHKILLK